MVQPRTLVEEVLRSRDFRARASRCFRRCLPHWQWRRKASRRRFSKSTSPTSRPRNSYSARSSPSWSWRVAECLLGLVLLFTYFGLSFRRRSHAFHRGHDLVRFLCRVVRHNGRGGDSKPGGRHASRRTRRIPAGVSCSRAFCFPIENIPAGLRWLSNFIWGRYYIEIVRDALLARRRLAGNLVQSRWSSPSSAAIFYFLAWCNMRRMQLKE